MLAALLLTTGSLADLFGRRLVFMIGLVIFSLSSLLSGVATDPLWLNLARGAQGIGGAAMFSTSLALLGTAFQGRERGVAFGAWGAITGLAVAIGPVVGGALTTGLSWRWIFLVNVPIGMAALIVGWRRLPHVAGHETERPDPLGVVLATTGVAVLTFGIVKGSDWGWGSAAIVGTLAVAAVLVALFVLHCLASRNPLIHPSLFRSRSFTGASIVAIFFSAAFGAMLLSIVLWEQGVWGWSALRAGLAVAPGPLMVPLMSFVVAGRLITRYGPAVVIALGSLAFGAGIVWWALAVGLQPNYAADLLGGMILTGIGVGLTLPTMMATASSSLPPQSFATGSAVINMLRQTGLALGVAILVAVLGTGHHGIAELDAFRHGWWMTAAIAFGGVVPAVILLRRSVQAGARPRGQSHHRRRTSVWP